MFVQSRTRDSKTLLLSKLPESVLMWKLASTLVIGQEGKGSKHARGDSDWILGRLSSQEDWCVTGTCCPGKWWSPFLEVLKERIDVLKDKL